MPKIRSLKPEHKQHWKIGPLEDRDYRLWVGLVTEADDEGRLQAILAQLRVLVFGYKPEVTDKDVQTGLERLEGASLLTLYVVDDRQYAALHDWPLHQRIDSKHFTPSKLPAPPGKKSPARPRASAEAQPRLSRAQPSAAERSRARLSPGSGVDLDLDLDRKGSEGRGAEMASGGVAPTAIAIVEPTPFEAFWERYPKKRAKEDAVRAWKKLAPDLPLQAKILAAVENQRRSLDWLKDGGKFIPYGATWLNGQRWTDVLEIGLPNVSEKTLRTAQNVQRFIEAGERKDRERSEPHALPE